MKFTQGIIGVIAICVSATQGFSQTGKVSTLKNTKIVKPVSKTVPPAIDTICDINMNSVVWQQRSGEYKALCYQAFSVAKMRLQEKIAMHAKDGLPLAIITDIDETILNNSPQSAKDILNHRTYADSNWKKWSVLSSAEAVPGAVAFFQYADKMGIQCFYISNRKNDETGWTIKNLISAGFPQVDSAHVFLRDTTSNKEYRRAPIRSQYNIAMLLGDNLNDFDKMFYHTSTDTRNQMVKDNSDLFGDIFIVLPNPMYGDWESALWINKKVTPEETKRIKREALLSF